MYIHSCQGRERHSPQTPPPPPRLLTPESILDAAEARRRRTASTRSACARSPAASGAVPMALYNHFATKEQLVDALLDRVLGRFEPDPPSRRLDRGPARLRPCAPAPAGAPSVGGGAAVQPAQPRARRGPRRRVRARHPPPRRPLRRPRGRDLQRADRAQLRLVVLQHRARPRPGQPRARRRRGARPVAARGRSRSTVSVAAELGAYGSDEHYDFVLDQFLGGLRATTG